MSWPRAMPVWRRRVMIYRAFGALPGGARVFDWVRRRFGGLRNSNLDREADFFDSMSRLLDQGGKSVAGKELAEVGTGWHPALPAVFHALGARRVRMTDIEPHVRPEFLQYTVDYLIAHSRMVAEKFGAEEAVLVSRWRALQPGNRPWREVWRDAGIEYLAPFDFTRTGWPDASVDMVFSNSCLSYIPRPELARVFRETARVLRPEGWTVHDTSVADDLAGYDESITPFNFLYYSEQEWKEIGDSRIHHQNRLRPSDYETLCRSAGLNVKVSIRIRGRVQPEGLCRDRLAPEFRGCTDDDLLPMRHLFLAEKAKP